MQTRRSCSACRFQKCLNIGMKVEILLSNKEKRRPPKDKIPSIKPPKVIEVNIAGGVSAKPLNRYEQECIDQVNKISAQCFNNETDVPELGEFTDFIEAFNITEIYVKKYVEFGKSFEPFSLMPATEQVALLKRVFPNLFSLKKILNYDPKRKGCAYFDVSYSKYKFKQTNTLFCFQNEDCSSCLFFPFMSVDDKISPNILNQCINYHEQLQKEYENDLTMLNLSHISMFFHLTGDEARDRQCEHLLYHHHFYRYLFRRYLTNKYQSSQRAQMKMVQIDKKIFLLFDNLQTILKDLLDNIDFTKMTHLTVEIYNLL